MRSLICTTTPALPITLMECKLQARVDDDLEVFDSLFESYRRAATEECQRQTGRQLCTGTWEWRFREWPDGDELELPKPPLQSITHIKYYDSSDVQQTLSTDDYSVDIYRTPGRVVLDSGASWPNLYDRWDAVLITFVAGYGNPGDVPHSLRVAMRELVAHRFRHPEAVLVGTSLIELPMNVRQVFTDYAVKRRVGV